MEYCRVVFFRWNVMPQITSLLVGLTGFQDAILLHLLVVRCRDMLYYWLVLFHIRGGDLDISECYYEPWHASNVSLSTDMNRVYSGREIRIPSTISGVRNVNKDINYIFEKKYRLYKLIIHSIWILRKNRINF